MFTGIIKELGTVRRFDRTGANYRLSISAKTVLADVDIGGSVSVNGVCLTLVEKKNGIMRFDVMEETASRSNLTGLRPGEIVNLEPALRADGSLGGHFVLGHVDCVGTVNSVKGAAREYMLEVGFPKEFTKLIVPKGSVALDGVSLTVGEAREESLRVYLIPHTLKTTNLGMKKAGDAVNIEFDVIGKYVERMGKKIGTSRITDVFLREKGF